MGKETYVAPQLGLKAFTCPECKAFSHQTWNEVIFNTNGNSYKLQAFTGPRVDVVKEKEELPVSGLAGHSIFHITAFSHCYSCKAVSIWKGNNMVHPNNLNVEPPSLDMPADIVTLYNEARSIAHLSPKSAAGLLRLALEKLLIYLGAKKGTIDSMIQNLVDKEVISPSGLVRKALDSIREIGNAGVHTTTINLDEKPEAAFALFKVINFVVEKMITDKKIMEEIYSFIPQEKREKLDIKRGIES
ncbi:DUF4145 domain-containing protein [Priestia megaterium]|uniref:DUF4145 domain-containing protein n=1 Tax=Priestia megaterium TaxID=1404 RepID=UPI00300A195E